LAKNLADWQFYAAQLFRVAQ